MSPDGLFLFILASTFGLFEPWYTFRDLCGPPLISSALRSFGTLPERYLRYLGKLLNQLPIVRRDFVSPWQLIYILRRGMPSHSSFDASFFYTVPCLPQVRLGHMMFVSLTHHSYFTVIALTFSQPFHGSRTVLSLPDSLKDFYRSGLYLAASSFEHCWDRLHRSPHS